MTPVPARRRRVRGDQGAAALELAVLAPALLALIAAVIAVGRIAIAGGAVEAAARDAARQASIARTPAAARAAARSSALASLRASDLACAPTVTVDTGGFATPIGAPAAVRVRVTCPVQLSDLLVPGLPGTVTKTGSFTSPIDPYRGR